MYKGGTHKIGRLSTMNESKATGYPNDYSVLSYDFQAPISEYGEIKEHYRLLNMLHMFVDDFGDILAPMEYVGQTDDIKADNLTDLRYAMRTDGKSGFVFVNHYQRLAKMADIENAVIDTGTVVFPSINVKGDIAFIMPFNIELSGSKLEYATAQPLCRIGNTYFFAEIDGITPEYKFEDKAALSGGIVKLNDIQIVTLTPKQAKYARKLSGTLYIGDDCDIFERDGEICSAQGGSFEYYKWNGAQLKKYSVEREFTPAEIAFEPVNEPFAPPYLEELSLGGERRRAWCRISVTSDDGFVDVPFEYDVAQIYADGELISDNYYYGIVWRVPANLLYGRDCYLVMSEMKNDFYREV